MPDESLKKRHAANQTPKDALNTLVAETTGKAVVAIEQIVRGYANEVYRVWTTNGERLIVRIQQHGMVDFETEAWAMARCRDAGIPVPHVHGITRTGSDHCPRNVMVLDQAPGKSLAETLADLDLDQRKHVFQQVGAALRAMHDIPAGGFGPLRLRTAGDGLCWDEYADRLIADRRNDIPFLIQAGLGEDEATRLLAIVETLPSYPCVQPALCHGDMADEHIFIDDDLNLTGIIDFGMCQGGPGILDVAVLLMFHPDVELEWLAQGYGPTLSEDHRIREQIVAHQVNVGMSYLAHDTREGNHDSTEIALSGLRALLQQ